eukprot:Rmarinus@m.15445
MDDSSTDSEHDADARLSSRPFEVSRTVLIVGSSGAGKSTLFNMLYNNDCSPDSCVSPSKVDQTAAPVTNFNQVFYHPIRRVCFVDTVGLGDPNLTDIQIAQQCRYVTQELGGVNLIIFVVRMDSRLSAADRLNIYLLDSIFPAGWQSSHGVLVLTHWNGESGHEIADLNAWVGNDANTREFVGRFGTKVVANNGLRRGAMLQSRLNCVDVLRNRIDSNTIRIHPVPTSFVELVRSLLRAFRELFAVSGKVQISEDEIRDVSPSGCFCGDCPICFSEVGLAELAQLVPCDHCFHSSCIRLVEHYCPLCRQAIEAVYVPV